MSRARKINQQVWSRLVVELSL